MSTCWFVHSGDKSAIRQNNGGKVADYIIYELAELKNIEEREGKTFHYYSLAVMISAKQINNLISQDKFDAEAAMKKVAGFIDGQEHRPVLWRFLCSCRYWMDVAYGQGREICE